jgi:selenocysteine-specific elongation factor
MNQATLNGIRRLLAAAPNGITTQAICDDLRQSPQQLGDCFEKLIDEEKAIGFAGVWLNPEHYEALAVRVEQELLALHQANPRESSFPVSQLERLLGLKWGPKPVARLFTRLADDQRLYEDSGRVSHLTVQFRPSDKQAALLSRVQHLLDSYGINPPPPAFLCRELGIPQQAVEEILRVGARAGQIVQLDEAVCYTTQQFEHIEANLRAWAGTKSFAPNEVRDYLGSTRKYVHPLLSYFDEMGWTDKVGPNRTFISKQR